MKQHSTAQHQSFIGSKIVMATAMTRLAFCNYIGREIDPKTNADEDGYLVEYTDGGQSNHPDHAGYISWSPRAQFDAGYLALGKIYGMPAHQQRVIAEKAQLDDKLAKLGAALNGALKGKVSTDEYSLLCEQERVMREYDEILRRRIDNFRSVR